MLELHFPAADFSDGVTTQMREVTAYVTKIRAQRGNRAGNQALFEKIGFLIGNLDEAYCREALDYHLGMVSAHADDPETAALYFQLSNTLPGIGGNKIFSDHLIESVDIRRRQESGIGRALPSVLLASMPRSGSASLTQTIASQLDLPIVRVSSGSFPSYWLVPRWFNIASSGGTVFHDHFSASEFNLKVLRDAGVRDIFVRVRDPRAATYSLVRLSRQYSNRNDAPIADDEMLSWYTNAVIPWFSSWITAATDGERGIRVHWSVYRPGVVAMAEAARDILATLAASYPAIGRHLEGDIRVIGANLVAGDDDAWRQVVTPRGQERIWEATPPAIREFLGLRAPRVVRRRRVERSKSRLARSGVAVPHAAD